MLRAWRSEDVAGRAKPRRFAISRESSASDFCFTVISLIFLSFLDGFIRLRAAKSDVAEYL